MEKDASSSWHSRPKRRLKSKATKKPWTHKQAKHLQNAPPVNGRNRDIAIQNRRKPSKYVSYAQLTHGGEKGGTGGVFCSLHNGIRAFQS